MAGEIAQWVMALAARPDDLSMIRSIHVMLGES